jgi:hypothetical protein
LLEIRQNNIVVSGYFKNFKESLGLAKEPEKNLQFSGWSSDFFEKLGNCGYRVNWPTTQQRPVTNDPCSAATNLC